MFRHYWSTFDPFCRNIKHIKNIKKPTKRHSMWREITNIEKQRGKSLVRDQIWFVRRVGTNRLLQRYGFTAVVHFSKVTVNNNLHIKVSRSWVPFIVYHNNSRLWTQPKDKLWWVHNVAAVEERWGWLDLINIVSWGKKSEERWSSSRARTGKLTEERKF